MILEKYYRYLPTVFWFSGLLILVACLMPVDDLPKNMHFWDKAEHALAYAWLALLGLLSYPKSAPKVVLGLSAYGAVIEFLQETLTTSRHAEFNDWIADTLGVLLGFALFKLWQKIT